MFPCLSWKQIKLRNKLLFSPFLLSSPVPNISSFMLLPCCHGEAKRNYSNSHQAVLAITADIHHRQTARTCFGWSDCLDDADRPTEYTKLSTSASKKQHYLSALGAASIVFPSQTPAWFKLSPSQTPLLWNCITPLSASQLFFFFFISPYLPKLVCVCEQL